MNNWVKQFEHEYGRCDEVRRFVNFLKGGKKANPRIKKSKKKEQSNKSNFDQTTQFVQSSQCTNYSR